MLSAMFIVFLVALFLALPIAVAMGCAALVPSFINPAFAGNPFYIITSMVGGLNVSSILAIPLFMLSGALMCRGGISERLFNIFAYIVGKRRAGIPCAVVVTCLFYGAISGSGPATAAAVGAMTIPVMVRLGYDKTFAGAVVAVAGGLGIIIPPSIPFILYGLFTSTSVGALFKAGIIPGCLIAFCLMLYCWIYCKRHGEDTEKISANYESLKAQGFGKLMKEGFWAVLTPVIILGTIYGGVCTPTEAACISVVYALVVCVFVYKTVDIHNIWTIFKEGVASYAPILLMIAISQGFVRVLSLLKAPAIIAAFISSNVSSKFAMLLLMNVVLLVLGMFMESSAAVIILSPMLYTIGMAYGVDPVHLGVFLIVNTAIGFVSPPFGLNLFVVSPLIETPVATMGKKVIPFLGFFLIALLLITYVPQISLCLL